MNDLYSAIGEDSSGDEVLEQAAVGDSEEEFIYMRRNMKDVEPCERDEVQVRYRKYCRKP